MVRAGTISIVDFVMKSLLTLIPIQCTIAVMQRKGMECLFVETRMKGTPIATVTAVESVLVRPLGLQRYTIGDY